MFEVETLMKSLFCLLVDFIGFKSSTDEVIDMNADH